MNKIQKEWLYKKIIKEAELKDKWLKNEEITSKEIAEAIYIDNHLKTER